MQRELDWHEGNRRMRHTALCNGFENSARDRDARLLVESRVSTRAIHIDVLCVYCCVDQHSQNHQSLLVR